jgi:hypothetical protein
MQLIQGFHPLNFPFVLAINKSGLKVFLVNTKTKERVALINLRQLHKYDSIQDIH